MEAYELTPERCKYWAKVPAWSMNDARLLAYGLDPDAALQFPFGLADKAEESFHKEIDRHKGREHLLGMLADKPRHAPTAWMRIMDDVDIECHKLLRDAVLSQPNPTGSDVDPADWPEELFAAVTAFRAVSNGYGDPSDTVKNRLTAYLKECYSHLSQEAVNRISTVANPDKSRGRPKTEEK